MRISMTVVQAWKLLDGGGSDPDRLRAIAAIGGAISGAGDPQYLRLEEYFVRAPYGLKRAVERQLLQVRRSGSDWDVLSRTDDGEGRISSDLTEIGERLREPNPTTRLVVVRELVEREAFGAAPVLGTRILTERDPMVLAALARALGYLGAESCLPALKTASRHAEKDVRFGAVEGLRYQCGEGAVQLLLDRISDVETQIRGLAREALASYSPDLLLAFLQRLPAGRGDGILRGALGILQRWVDDDDVRQFLTRLSAWPNDEICDLAERLLAGEGRLVSLISSGVQPRTSVPSPGPPSAPAEPLPRSSLGRPGSSPRGSRTLDRIAARRKPGGED